MTPTTIDEAHVWEGARRMVIGPPDGDPTGDIRAVEAIVDVGDTTGLPRFCMRIALDDGDLAKLRRDPHFWLVICGQQLQPFDVVVPDEVPVPTFDRDDLVRKAAGVLAAKLRGDSDGIYDLADSFDDDLSASIGFALVGSVLAQALAEATGQTAAELAETLTTIVP